MEQDDYGQADRLGRDQYLTFTVGGEDFGVDILKVQEIRGWEPVRPLPDTPPYVKGVLDLRGTIVPIIDLRVRFGRGEPDYTPTTVIIVLAVRHADTQVVMGLVVDGVSDVLDAVPSEMRPAPRLGARINTRYIKGVISRAERMVILLDADLLLRPDELGLLESLQ